MVRGANRTGVEADVESIKRSELGSSRCQRMGEDWHRVLLLVQQIRKKTGRTGVERVWCLLVCVWEVPVDKSV